MYSNGVLSCVVSGQLEIEKEKIYEIKKISNK